ncbi:hypothetical protein [Tsuneonella sp. HG222]
MKPLRYRAFAAFVLAILVNLPAQASAEWLRADSKHFILYSEGSEGELRRFADDAEKFDALLRGWFKAGAHEDASRLPIFILEDTDAVSRLRGVSDGSLGGFYTGNTEGAFAVSSRERAQSEYQSTARQVLFHEYAHHFFTRYVPDSYPLWLFEGFAEYFSYTTFSRTEGYTVGNVAKARAYGLLDGDRLPIKRILTGDLEGLNAMQSDVFYGRSWLLTHALISTPEGLAKLDRYMRAFGSGSTPEEAAVEAFGSLDDLDSELLRLTRRGLTSFTSKNALPYDGTVTVTRLSPMESDLLEARIARRASIYPAQALARAAALAASAPDNPAVLAELAQAEFAVGEETEDKAVGRAHFGAAQAAADLVLAVDPKNVAALMTKGLTILEMGDGSPSDADVAEARKLFVRANNADPSNPQALYEFYRTYSEYGKRPPDVAIQGLEAAFGRAPEIVDYRVELAMAYADQGKFEPALSLVQFLAFHPHYSKQGKDLVEKIEKMRSDRADYDGSTDAEGEGSA